MRLPATIGDRAGPSALALMGFAVLLCSSVAPARAAIADWMTSDLDVWVYNEVLQAGASTAAPTWLNELVYNPTTQQFDPSVAENPARLGSALFAFNSTAKVTPGLAAHRYQINSVVFTASCEFPDTVAPLYESAPISQSQILAEFASGNTSWQKPMELYGAGLRAGYTGYEFGGAVSGPPLLDEITKPYLSGSGGYIAYPIVGSTSLPGAYVDVSNSVTGGFSATEPSSTTAPFTPTPWAIGTTNLAVGAVIPDDTTFTFTLDLNAPGVRSYIQQSLSSGAVGLFVSSLHATSFMGGTGVYPRWFTKEAAGFPDFRPAALMPHLAIDYEILPAGLPGDYNQNGSVDAADYVLWRNGGPLQNEVATPGSVTAEDYAEWRARFGNASAAAANLGGGAFIPEPATIVVMFSWMLWILGAARSQRVYG